jgi:WD40 repeat protein
MHRVDNGQNFRNFGGGSDFMFSVAASPDGKLVVAGGQDSVLRFWDGENGNSLRNLDPPQPETQQVAAQETAK